MKKHETLSKSEELLAQVLDECLEEDLSFIPPEREIARKHRFSEKFEKTVNELLENTSNETRKKEIQKHFSPRYGQWAACILLFCICSGLFYYVIRPFSDGSGSMQEETAAVTEESAFDGAAPEESAPEAAEAEEEATAKGGQTEDYAEEAEGMQKSASEKQTSKIFCGQTVYLADKQEVPETLENVTTLVNCPVLDEENPVLILTIGNVGETEIHYLNQYTLEVWLDDGWYIVPERSDRLGEWLTLEAKMAVDEEIDLTDYQIDYGAQQYRLIAYVDEEKVSAEFTFTDGFTETMEKLKEEEKTSEE